VRTPDETVFTNARVVTCDSVFAGTVVVRGGAIAAVDEGRSALAAALDLDGDTLLPGLVELHTDTLEKHFLPRPGVRWPSKAAVIAHDLQVSAAGITTVFDALAVGDIRADAARLGELRDMADTLARAREDGILRAEHAVHMRCEVGCETLPALFEPFAAHPLVRLVSVMDHTPGQRQFRGDGQYRSYYKSKWNISEAEIDAFIARRRETGRRHAGANRRRVAEFCRARGLPLASHDDATAAHVEEAAALGVGLAEFPTTEEAARAAHDNGIRVIAGAPNLVRGGSHSGNVSAQALGGARLVDILSSDYVPVSLLHAAFVLHQADGIGLALPAAVATVTLTPARAVGLDDRGEIAPARAADLVRVRLSGDLPIVRGVWRRGERVG
jgi:alpha-D-ribose 1-methylphosphonate 5-triphosphate diphosphatase